MTLSTRIKVCGMKSAEDVELAINCGVDAVGFITDVPVVSPRKITLAKATELIDNMPFFVNSVLVIMPDSAKHAVNMVKTANPDVVQIHNSPNLNIIQCLRKYTDANIIQTFHIPVNEQNLAENLIRDIKRLTCDNFIDGILLDTQISEKVGGTGMMHNLSISRQIVEQIDIPVISAGGLNPDNVAECINIVKPFAVDVASGVEVEGMKSADKIKNFVKAVRCRQ